MGRAQSSDDLEPEPKPGDLIEIDRGGYNHWAVYIGGPDREVVHLTVPDGALGVSASGAPSTHSRNGMVKKEPLSKVAAGRKYRVIREYDKKYKPQPVEKIVRDAKAKVGKLVKYHLLQNNCEHFAMELRYGVRKSRQVETGLTIGGASIGTVTLAATAVLGILSSRQRT